MAWLDHDRDIIKLKITQSSKKLCLLKDLQK